MRKQLKKYVLEMLVLLMTVGLFGCGKKVTEHKNEFLVTAKAHIREEEDGKRLIIGMFGIVRRRSVIMQRPVYAAIRFVIKKVPQEPISMRRTV